MTENPRSSGPSHDDAMRLARIFELGLETRRFVQVGAPTDEGVYRVLDIDSFPWRNPSSIARPKLSITQKILRELRRAFGKLSGKSSRGETEAAQLGSMPSPIPPDVTPGIELRRMLSLYEQHALESPEHLDRAASGKE